MKFLVAHIGARRAYAVPAILEKAGLLDRFYTDFCLGNGCGNLVWSARHIFPRFREISGRCLPANLRSKTRTFDAEFIRYLLVKGYAKTDAFDAFATRLGNQMVRAGLGHATHFYSMMGEVTPLLIEAHKSGLTTTTEIFILLSAYKKIDAECAKFPGVETLTTASWRDNLHRWLNKVLGATTLAVAPANRVAEDLVSEFGFPSDRIAVVPYAADEEWFSLHNQPEPGRIFFAGTVSLRKGIQYLGLAAAQIDNKNLQFRIAGNVEQTLSSHPMMRRLEFLGRISRQDMAREFEKCDLFVLPTLAEGSAEVVYQAMAAGVPVITTYAAGSVIRHGVDGWIVPEGDAEALRQAILQLREDRPLRNSVAQAAKARAADFTWPRYGERLLAALNRPIAATSLIRGL
jgi:glycosyltransferase involved in cell wall biosynthesis